MSCSSGCTRIIHFIQTGYNTTSCSARFMIASHVKCLFATNTASTLLRSKTSLTVFAARKQYSASARVWEGVVGTPVEILGSVKKILSRSNGGTSLTVHIDDTSWQGLPEVFKNSAKTKCSVSYSGFRTDKKVTVVCNGQKDLEEGNICMFKGIWAKSGANRLQVAAEEAVLKRSKALQDVKMRLEKEVPGVGPKVAALVVDDLKHDTESVLNSPDAVQRLQRINGIGLKKAEMIKKGWDKTSGDYQAKSFLKGLGLKRHQIQAAIDRYGKDNVKDAFASDPHMALAVLPGFSFKLAEHIAHQLGVQPMPVSRGAAAMLQALVNGAASSGHSFLVWRDVKRRTAVVLHEHSGGGGAGGHGAVGVAGAGGAAGVAASSGHTAAELQPEALLEKLQSIGCVVVEPCTSGLTPPAAPPAAPSSTPAAPPASDTRVYLSRLHEAETQVASILSNMMAHTLKHPPHAPPQTPWGSSTPLPPPSSISAPAPLPPSFCNAASTSPPASSDGGAALTMAGHSSSDPMPLVLDVTMGSPSPEELPPDVFRLLSNLPFQLTAKQVDALLMARSQPVALLTGAAGCGKTLVTRAIVKLWKRQGKRVLMCAPTGRAAQRLQEVAEDPDLTATTVHRLLGYKRERSKDEIKAQRDAASGAGQEQGRGSGAADGGEQVAVVTASANNCQMDLLDVNAFEFGPDNRLQADAVLVDEASMLDVQLMWVLLRALPQGCQLLLVGDPNQLAPVGPGSVMADMIATRAFPREHLDKIFRQEAANSSIVQGAHNIIAGSSPYPHFATIRPQYLLEGGPGSQSDPAACDQPAQQQPEETLTAAVSTQATKAITTTTPRECGASTTVLAAPAWAQALHKRFGRDAVLVEVEDGCGVEAAAEHVVEVVHMLKAQGVEVDKDMQVLSPTRKTAGGVLELNRRLQPIMNPRLASDGGVGGAGSSSWAQSGRPAWRQELHVGDRVVQVENNYEKDVFNGDLGTVSEVNEKERSCTVTFAPRPGRTEAHRVTLLGWDRSQVALAWATTVHKAQGGEFPAVVVVLHQDMARSLLQRQLLYTAVTRARHLLIVVSTRSALLTASSHASVQTRNSLLQPRLTALLQARSLPVPPPVGAVAGPTKTRRSLTPSARKTTLADVQARTPTAQAAMSAAAAGSAVAAAEPLPTWPPLEFGGCTKRKASSPRASKKTKALAAAPGDTDAGVAMEAAVGEQHRGTAAASKLQSRAASASEHGQELGAELVMDAPTAAAPSLPDLPEEAVGLAQAPSGASPRTSSPKPRATSWARRASPPLPQPPTTKAPTCIQSGTQVAPDAVAEAAPDCAGDECATTATEGAAVPAPDTPRAVVAAAVGPKRRSFYGR